jgi:hypothetical protein
MLTIERAQGTFGQLYGPRAAELFVLAQEEVVTAQFVLGGAGGNVLEVIGKPPHVANAFLFGGLTTIFELDKVREPCDGWRRRDGGVIHRWLVCP